MAIDIVETLLSELLEWIGPTGRPYDAVIEAWRTSCPQLAVWEEATRRGLVDRPAPLGGVRRVTLSVAGRAHLQQVRRQAGTSPT